MNSAQSTFQHLTVVPEVAGDRKTWTIRIALVVVLLALVIGLSYVHITGTYKPIMNCQGVFVTGLKFDPWICNGYSIAAFDVGPWEVGPWDIGPVHIHATFGYHSNGYTIPGLAPGINVPLEAIRGVTVWTILIFFVIVSLALTLIYNIFIKPLIEVIKRLLKPSLDNGEEWRKLLGTVRTWSLILAVFLLLFLFSVGQARGLGLPPLLQPVAKILGWS